MTELKRWLDDSSELSGDERRALTAALSAPKADEFELVEEAKHAVWNALVPMLPAASGAALGTTALAAGKASLLATLAKPLAIGVALGTVTAGGLAFTLHEPAPQPPPIQVPAISAPVESAGVAKPSSPARSLERVPTASDPPESPNVRGTVVAPRASSPSASPSGALAAPASGLHPSVASFPSVSEASAGDSAEIRRMAAARTLLRSGQPRAALRELDAIATNFPNGTLAQEREALAVEALSALGERAAARERASRFLSRYPSSPHAAAVRRALE
jgi:hypothetical protein